MLFWKIVVLILSVTACVYVIRYRLQMVGIFGRAAWADRYLGSAYNLWIVIGLLMVFMAATWLFK